MKNAPQRPYSQQYLNRVLNGRAGCLETLSGQQEAVLVLRTGITGGRSFTATETARILKITRARETQLEHQGIAGITSAAKRGCPALGPAALSGLNAAAGIASQFEGIVPSALGAPATASASSGQGEAAKSGGQTSTRSSVSGTSTHVQGAVAAPPHSGSSTLLWILLGAGVIAASAVGTPLARRRARLRLAAAAARSAGVATNGAVESAAAVSAGHISEAAALAPAAALVGGAAAAGLAERDPEPEDPIALYSRADAAGDAAAATNLGVVLEQRGDLEGAIAAYRRADERGDVNGSFNLGCLLSELGDGSGAMAALRRADVRGDAAGASNLGVLLERAGDVDGALAAYRRADERGDANGAFNLGLLLAARGEIDAARDAYARAEQRGEPDVQERARAALHDLNGHGGR